MGEFLGVRCLNCVCGVGPKGSSVEEQQSELRLFLFPRANFFLSVLHLQGQNDGQDSIIALKIV